MGYRPPTSPRLFIWAGIAGVLALGLDQASKAWILKALALPPHKMPIMEYLSFDLVWNYGVTFGMFSDPKASATLLWCTMAAFMIAYLLGYLWRVEHWLGAVAAGMIIGGAIGNVIDRLQFGAVVDFIHVMYYPWVFNIADCAVVTGVGILIWDPRKKPPPPDPAG